MKPRFKRGDTVRNTSTSHPSNVPVGTVGVIKYCDRNEDDASTDEPAYFVGWWAYPETFGDSREPESSYWKYTDYYLETELEKVDGKV